ncbi:MAG: FAD-dependent oxidoreductase [Sphingomicrobium sp.]
MSSTSDILVIGGGIAGLSVAATLARNASVTLIEAEEQTGFHTSGRSATMFHYALGNPLIRALTRASRPLFDAPPDGFSEAPLGHQATVLVHARADELDALAKDEAAMAPFTHLERLDESGIARLCPLLRVGEGGAMRALADHDCLRLDQHALMQGYGRQLRARGGRIVKGARASRLVRRSGVWSVTSERGEDFLAPVIVNAAGAWADGVAKLAGVAPIGLRPLRRTIITFDAPGGTDLAHLPFTKTVGDELYFGPESGRLLASPMDEEPSEPCDSQPDDLAVATAAHRMEERTTVEVRHIHAKWSGLRTFTPDRVPAVGYAPNADGFFWLAGQGGSGLQTAPALSAVAAALVERRSCPVEGVDLGLLTPARFAGQSAEVDPALADQREQPIRGDFDR